MNPKPVKVSPEIKAYMKRIEDQLEGRDPVKVQAATYKKLVKLVEGLSARELDYARAPDRWSIRDIIGHLADGEIANSYRYRKILAEDRPKIEGYDQEAFTERLRKQKEPVRDALERFRILREANLKLIRSTPKSDWERYGMHAERGKESFGRIVILLAGHDINHLKQIEAIRKEMKGR